MICKSDDSQTKYRCPRCGKPFTNSTGLSYHIDRLVCLSKPSINTPPPLPPVLLPPSSPSTLQQDSPTLFPNSQPPPVSLSSASFRASQEIRNPNNPAPPAVPSPQTPSMPRAGDSEEIPRNGHVPTYPTLESNGTPRADQVSQSQVLSSITGNESTRSSSPQPCQSPSNPTKDPYAHLSPHLRSALLEELRQAEELFSAKMEQAHKEGGTPDKINARMETLRASHATKQSQIRKKYNVRLRVRRSRAEMQAQFERMTKRIRVDEAGNSVSSRNTMQSDAGSDTTPRKHSKSSSPRVKVAPAGNGLQPTEATPALVDPTADEKPRPPLTSLRRSVSSTTSPIRQSPLKSQEPPLISPGRPRIATGTVTEPVMIDDETDSDDSVEDIPANVPSSAV